MVQHRLMELEGLRRYNALRNKVLNFDKTKIGLQEQIVGLEGPNVTFGRENDAYKLRLSRITELNKETEARAFNAEEEVIKLRAEVESLRKAQANQLAQTQHQTN